MDNPKQLMVIADDFGFSHPINAGVVHAFEKGIVTTAAIMANGDAFDEACELASHITSLPVGLHINLTQGKPVLSASQVSSLVDREGNFYAKWKFVARIISGRIDSFHIYEEVNAQADRLAQRGISIIHVSSHHHIHALPQVAAVVAECAKKQGIRWVRRISRPKTMMSGYGGVKAFVQQSFVSRLMQLSAKHLDPFGAADQFWGFEVAAAKNKFHAISHILQHVLPGRHELMCHPVMETNKNEDCYNELSVLCNQRIKKIIMMNNTLLVTPSGVRITKI